MFLFYSIIFVLGLTVGSFLNVVIFRLETGDKIVNDRSKCMSCGHILAWYDLIPIFSFIFLKSKCRYCKRPISWQYPIVEFATGMLFILIFNFFAQSESILDWQFLLPVSYLLFVASSLLVIFVYDLKHYIIPDKVIYPVIAVVFVYKLFEILNSSSWVLFGFLNSALNLFLPAILTGGFFYVIIIMTKGKGMGGGDVKLGFLMGFILNWTMVLVALFLSFLVGAIVGLLLILIGKKKMKSAIPFGPFLVLGTFVAMFWGEDIVKWYMNMII